MASRLRRLGFRVKAILGTGFRAQGSFKVGGGVRIYGLVHYKTQGLNVRQDGLLEDLLRLGRRSKDLFCAERLYPKPFPQA